MSNSTKVTKLISKTLLFSILVVFSLLITLFILLQTTSFQTWLAHKATNYLSKELGADVKIERVKISFIKNVSLQGVFVSDIHHDTLVYGKEITINVSGFNFNKKKLSIDEVKLNQVKIKLLKYVGEPDWNFQFLADYFASNDSLPKDTTSSPWKIRYGALKLADVDFTYRLFRDTNKVVRNMNYNHIHVSNIYGTFTQIKINADTIAAQITNLSAKEHSGIEVKNLTTLARVSSTELRCDSMYLKTANSFVKGQLQFQYSTWSDYIDFIEKVYMKGNFKDSTYVNFKDIAYFAEDINGMNEVVVLKGKVQGFVNDLHGKDMMLSYRENTQFIGDASITGLPDFEKSYMHFDAKKLTTTKSDLEKFPLPPFTNPTHLNLPSEVEKLGIITYKGKFDGFINSFITYGSFKTDIGNVKADMQISNVSNGKLMSYSGTFETSNLNLSKLFPNFKLVGPTSISAKIQGKGLTQKELDAKFDGQIYSATFNNYQYQHVKINGEFHKQIFTGSIISKDTNAVFDFNGAVDFNKEITKMNFNSTVHHLDLEKTNFATSQLNGIVSSRIYINLDGSNIDNLTGIIHLDNTSLQTPQKKHHLKHFDLELNQFTDKKNIKFVSDVADAELVGKFKLSTLPIAFNQYLNEYFPTFFKKKENYIYSDKADLKVQIKDFGIVNDLFIKNLFISKNTELNVSFDASINFLYAKVNSSLIDFADLKFKNNLLQMNSMPKGISLTYKANAIHTTDSFAFRNPSLVLSSDNTNSNFNLTWDNYLKPNNAGNIKGRANFDNSQATILFDEFKLMVEDSMWQMVKSVPIVIDTAYQVSIASLTLYNQNQLITLDGKLSKNVDERFDIFIQNFQLGQFNPFIKESKTTISGSLTGDCNIYGIFGNTILSSKINFKDFKFNNRLIGYGEIINEYNKEEDIVTLSGFSAFMKDSEGNNLKNIEFNGAYYPKKDTNNIDIQFKAEPFDLALLQPFVKDILTFKMGFLVGKGTVKGNIKDPQVNAKFKFFKCITVVDYTNVSYSINGEVEILPNQIRFDNVELRDAPNKGSVSTGNVGYVYGNIFHKNFKDMRIDFDINTNKLMLLNTNEALNPTFYGTAYAGGNIGIYGYLEDIKMELNLKTYGGTYIYIPLDGPSEINDNDFIKFVAKDTIKKIITPVSSNLSLDFNLEATKDAEIQLIFDEKSGDIIKARGDGNLNMKIDTKGKFDMFGDYVLNTGDYLFTLEDFITKRFEIEKGSSIHWNGNVYKANIDITANYKQRASTKPLFPNDSLNNYNKRVPVDCKLLMKGKLTSPDINFGIELPTIDENTRSAIKSIMSDENELKRQVFSMLLLRSFVTPLAYSGGGGISAGNAAAATGSEMLSNKVSSWLNGITKDMDIGVNYRPGGTLSSDELDLALSKQLFNNRLIIDGNFGVANNSNATNNSTIQRNNNTSNLIGDVSIEYKLSESGKYRIKAFNRSNDNTQSATTGGPFTQGVGIFYREEFDTLNQLFNRYLDKLKKKKSS